MEHSVFVSQQMMAVNALLVSDFGGTMACISQYDENLIVEVPRKDVDGVVLVLKKQFRDVVDIRKAYPMIEDLHDFILVKPLVSESPIEVQKGVNVPSIEKQLVDIASDKEYSGRSEREIRLEYQKAFEVYEINLSRMLRYASRKGEKDQVWKRIESVDGSRVALIKGIRSALKQTPVTDAWIFGSFSRMEERPGSDIDILFRYDKAEKFSILDHVGLKMELSKLTGREVDLVADGTLLPFAIESATRDKYKIYERET